VEQREEIVAQASHGRKGWRAPLRYLALLTAAALVALPVSFIGGMAMTPVLWRLEPVLRMELAGHSGPSDWILASLFGITTVLVFAALLWVTRSRPPTSVAEKPVNGFGDELT